MPATQELMLTRSERRRRKLLQNFNSSIVCFLTALALLAIPGSLGGIIYWMITDSTVADKPVDCFDVVKNCEVLTVTHGFCASSCVDTFTYTWKLPVSPVEYLQTESVERAKSNCPVELDISAKNATFPAGTTQCFSVNSRFSSYTSAFNCAKPFRTNNRTISSGTCVSLLPPTSDYDASFAVGIGAFLLVYLCWTFFFGGCSE